MTKKETTTKVLLNLNIAGGLLTGTNSQEETKLLITLNPDRFQTYPLSYFVSLYLVYA